MEIELKFPLLNSDELVIKLNNIAKPDKAAVLQKDIYFTPPHRNFVEKAPISEWLRLREDKKGSSINYKNWHKEKDIKSISCDEYESKVDDIGDVKDILHALDFKEIITVEKKRSTWNYKGTEIAIDHIKELGDFIEIEAKNNFADVADAKKHLFAVLKELGAKVGEQDFEGYPYGLLRKKGLIAQTAHINPV